MATTGTDMRGSGGGPRLVPRGCSARPDGGGRGTPDGARQPAACLLPRCGEDVVDIFRYRELLSQLVRKELKVKYKDSVLGFFWTLVRPMIQLVIYYVAFTCSWATRSRRTRSSSSPAWSSGACSPTSSAAAPGQHRRQRRPAEEDLLPAGDLPAVGGRRRARQLPVRCSCWSPRSGSARSPDSASCPPGTSPCVPLALLVCLVWATALGLFLAAATVYFRDLQHLIEIVLLALFWLVADRLRRRAAAQSFAESGHTALLRSTWPTRCSTWSSRSSAAFYTMGPEYTFTGQPLAALGVLPRHRARRALARAALLRPRAGRLRPGAVIHAANVIRVDRMSARGSASTANKSLKERLVNAAAQRSTTRRVLGPARRRPRDRRRHDRWA